MDTEPLSTARITEAFEAAIADATEFQREELQQVQHQLQALQAEDRGWTSLFGGGDDEYGGLTLSQLKGFSKILRESVAGSPLPKQANVLRYSYTFSHPFVIPGLTGSAEGPKKPGRQPKLPRLGAFYEEAVNQRYIFGKEAQELISTACSTDGCYLALGDDKTRKVRPVPIFEIVATSVDPDFPGEVWAYLREWNPNPEKPEELRKRWYYTDRFPNTREKELPGTNSTDETIPVDQDKTIIDLMVNQQVGWTFGVPDLQAGHIWNKKYITMMNHGEEVSGTLAYFAAKVKQKSQAGADKTGVKMGGTRQKAGNTVSYGDGNEIDVFSTAGKTYDFSGLNPVAGVYALSVGVSLVDLLSNPSASGSSYGAAKALDPATRRGIESRRSQIAGWLERVIQWGTGTRIKVTPASIEDVEPYRRAQILLIGWNSGLLHDDEVRPELLHIAGLTPKHDSAPEGVLVPNNAESLARKDIDADGAAGTGADNPQAPSADQGKSDGSGGVGGSSGKDVRTDTIA